MLEKANKEVVVEVQYPARRQPAVSTMRQETTYETARAIILDDLTGSTEQLSISLEASS